MQCTNDLLVVSSWSLVILCVTCQAEYMIFSRHWFWRAYRIQDFWDC